MNGFEQWNVHNQTLRWLQGGFDNTGTGTAGSWQIDLWSVATHEAGHASGFNGAGGFGGHWDPAAGICQWPAAGNGYHTMCKATPLGSIVQRDTEIHEETAFFARY